MQEGGSLLFGVIIRGRDLAVGMFLFFLCSVTECMTWGFWQSTGRRAVTPFSWRRLDSDFS